MHPTRCHTFHGVNNATAIDDDFHGRACSRRFHQSVSHGEFPAGWTLIKQLLQVHRLITPVLVELRAPHFVYALVLRTTEAHGRPEPNV